MSLRFHRGSLSNSWISIPKMSKNVSGAKWRWKGRAKGGGNKGGEGWGLWLARGPTKKRLWTKMTGSNGFFPTILFCAQVALVKAAKLTTNESWGGSAGLWGRYLQPGSVHVSRQLSSPPTGYHEHFIGVHLQKEKGVSAHITPAGCCEISLFFKF